LLHQLHTDNNSSRESHPCCKAIDFCNLKFLTGPHTFTALCGQPLTTAPISRSDPAGG
jgi:hypothetical protein